MKFEIYDGRKEFWQWDLNQKLIVNVPDCTEVHFCNKTDDCSLVCVVEEGLVSVPNILLQEARAITVFAFTKDGDEAYTKHAEMFRVLERTKPADYVYTETEVLTYKALENRLDGLENNAILCTAQDLTEEQQAQARENIGASTFYHTKREEIGVEHDTINAEYIWGLYDALMAKYPDNVQKKEHTNNDGTFANYEYVISTGEYRTDGLYATAYGCDPHIKKPKYLVLSGIHGTERKTTLSTYRFIRDVLGGHNVPPAFREGTIISVMPIGTPSAFDAFLRQSGNAVDINRNFDINWVEDDREDENGNAYTYGESAGSEKETQAIANWMVANSDAELFIDFHNSGMLNEKVVVMGLPDNSISNIARKIALRGVDRIIPFWKDVIGYPTTVVAKGLTDTDGDGSKVEERDVIFSYSASVPGNGMAFAYAQSVLGIRSIAIETVSYYGDYYEWQENQTTYQPEVIAMGAEALGNILIEFYAQSCEVTTMSDIDAKLDALVQSASFRTESGTIVLTEDMIADANPGYFMFEVPCSSGVKFFDFHADLDTREVIQATTGISYMASVFGNYFTPDVMDPGDAQIGFGQMMNHYTYNGTDYGWILRPATVKKMDPSDGYGFAFRCTALKAGTYHWTAYYWND